MTNPNSMLTLHPSDPISPRFSWRAALLGGAVAIACSVFVATLTYRIALLVLTSKGMSVQDAYAQLYSTAATYAFGHITSFLFCAIGGYVATSLAPSRQKTQAAASGLVTMGFVVITSAGPLTPALPGWSIALSLLLPIPAAIVGACFYVHRS